MRALTLEEAEAYVAARPGLRRWDGWCIVIWKEDPAAFCKPTGVYRNGKWGTERAIAPNAEGLWVVNGSRKTS
jgi:hypothetical protein